MSTRCMIGYTLDGKTATASYCHSDGYPSYTGVLLLGYTTLEEVKTLVDLGPMSHVGLFVTGQTEVDKNIYTAPDHSFKYLLYLNRTAHTGWKEYPVTGPIDEVMRTDTYGYLFDATQNTWLAVGDLTNCIWKPLSHALVNSIRQDIQYGIPNLTTILHSYYELRPRLVQKAGWFAEEADARIAKIEYALHGLYSITCYDNISYDVFMREVKRPGVPLHSRKRIVKVDFKKDVCCIASAEDTKKGNYYTLPITELVKFATFGLPQYMISNPAKLKDWTGWAV